MIKSRVGNILVKVAVLRINSNLDGSSIESKSHTHPSHSQNSRLLTSSLSLGIDDVEKLDGIQDDFIQYQLLRFYQTTRLQYINSHIILNNRCVLQKEHTDCEIVDTHLQKGTKEHTDVWDTSSKVWTHIVLYLRGFMG